MRSVLRLITAVQAVVAHTIAVAVARLLVDRGRDLRGQLISVSLVGIFELRSQQLLLGQNRGERLPLLRRSRVIRRDAALVGVLLKPLRRRSQRDEDYE